jgi:hypothetical protein
MEAGYHCSDLYIVNGERGYVWWASVAWLSLQQYGEADGGYRHTSLIVFTRTPYYHKRTLLELNSK